MRITEKRVSSLRPDYDDNRTWLENAEKEHGRQAFRAILSTDNPRNHDRVLAASAFDDLPGNYSLWQAARQSSSPRNASEMAELVAPLLVNCTELHFIDPHFNADNARHRKPMADFLKKVALCRESRPSIKRIVMHTSYTKEKASAAFFRQACERKLPEITPEGLQLELIRWQQRDGGEKLHNRYILTDIGGVKADPGLDEGPDGESFEAILLGRDLYEKHWNDYVLNPAFDLADPPVVITGRLALTVIRAQDL